MKIQNWLDCLRKPNRRSRSRAAGTSETLETKALLSVTTGFDSSSGELEIRSDAGDDITVAASEDGSDVLVNGESTGVAPSDVISLEVKGGPLANTLDVSAVTEADFTNLESVEVKGNGGDDILIGSEFDDDLEGGQGNDDIDGGDGADSLKGDDGDDTLVGGDGDDSLGGHEGDDDLDGGEGDDTLGGGGDDDNIRGGIGDDEIRAGSGHDDAHGGSGRDTMLGGGGRDSMDGSAGNDRVVGQDGSDYLEGGGGNDLVLGNRGSDQMDGGPGRDRLKGGSSNDLLRGGDDDDFLNGGRGDDLLDGDDGNDTERSGMTVDVEYDFTAELSAGAMTGQAEFELAEDGDVEMEFEVEVEDATPGTYEVAIDGVFIGELIVGEDGEGELEYSTNPDDDGELLLPSNFPTVQAGSVVSITGLASGVFDQEFDTDDDNNDWESEVEMTPLNGSDASGEIEFEVDEGHRSFQASFEDLTPGQYNLIVDGVVVETITISEDDDQFEIEYDDEDSDIAFPSNFPTLSAGSTIELGGVLSGQL